MRDRNRTVVAEFEKVAKRRFEKVEEGDDWSGREPRNNENSRRNQSMASPT